MESGFSETTRWCPFCEDRGVPIVWGYANEEHQRLAEEGRVILAGCVVTGMHPSHVCANCACEFIASSRIYQRRQAGADVYGVAVWPHGRRSVRIEGNDDGWTVMVDGEGAMLIDRHAMKVFPNDVFEDMRPWDVEEWAARRGFPASVTPSDEGWAIGLGESAGFFELLLIKTWWRSCEVSSPVWLPER